MLKTDIDIAAAVLLRKVRDEHQREEVRQKALIIYRAISISFSSDEEFRIVAAEHLEREL